MNVVDGLLTIKDNKELNHKLIEVVPQEVYTPRYMDESLYLGMLAEYALNKEKNKCKPDFEDLFSCDVLSIFQSEVRELQDEIIQDKIDPRKAFEEIADCAAGLVGLIANLRDMLKDK